VIRSSLHAGSVFRDDHSCPFGRGAAGYTSTLVRGSTPALTDYEFSLHGPLGTATTTAIYSKIVNVATQLGSYLWRPGKLGKDIAAGHAGAEVLVAHDPGSRRVAAQRPEPGNRTIEGGEHGRTWRNNAIHDIPVPSLFAWGSLSHAPRRQPSGSGISEVH
jgi:hypothetical protein